MRNCAACGVSGTAEVVHGATGIVTGCGDVGNKRDLCTFCLEKGGAKDCLLDGISYLLPGPDCELYYVPCAYTNGNNCGHFNCLPYKEKFAGVECNPILALYNNRLDLFQKYVTQGVFKRALLGLRQ